MIAPFAYQKSLRRNEIVGDQRVIDSGKLLGSGASGGGGEQGRGRRALAACLLERLRHQVERDLGVDDGEGRARSGRSVDGHRGQVQLAQVLEDGGRLGNAALEPVGASAVGAQLRSQPDTYYVLPTTYYLLPTTYYLLLG